MCEPTNTDRADWAHASLMHFAESVGMVDEDGLTEEMDTVIGDFLCDLRHYCQQSEINLAELWEGSEQTYIEELQEEEEGEDLCDES